MTERIIALDLGNGFVKTMSSTGGAHFPSVYALEEPGVSFEGLAAADDFVVELGGQRYAVGWSAARLGNIAVRTLDRSRVLGPEYRVLFAAGLVKACGQGAAVAPTLSLPVAWYDRRPEVKLALAGEWLVRCRGRLLHFDVPAAAMRIIPEGFGTICSLALDRNGRPFDNGLLGMTVGVVDVGTKTTDLSMFEGLVLVPARTDGFDIGLERVYNIMNRLAQRELGQAFTIEQLDDSLHGGRLYHGQRDISERLADWKRQALEQVADAIAGHIKSLWQGGLDVQKLLLTGGGGQHVYQYLARHFPDHLEPVADGPMANVVGAYRYALMKGEASYDPA